MIALVNHRLLLSLSSLFEPFPSQVKAVNTIIGKNRVGKTLTEAIDEIRHDNDVRDGMCDFDKLIDIIDNYKDKEGKTVVIESKFQNSKQESRL